MTRLFDLPPVGDGKESVYAWAIELPLKTISKLVLVVLVRRFYASRKWEDELPSRYIADMADVSERQVFRALNDLEEAGIIHRESKGTKGF